VHPSWALYLPHSASALTVGVKDMSPPHLAQEYLLFKENDIKVIKWSVLSLKGKELLLLTEIILVINKFDFTE
jgi:hypothetical protein